MTTLQCKSEERKAENGNPARKPNPRRDDLNKLALMIRRTEDFLCALRLRRDELLTQSQTDGLDPAINKMLDDLARSPGVSPVPPSSPCIRASVVNSLAAAHVAVALNPDPDAQVEHPERYDEYAM